MVSSLMVRPMPSNRGAPRLHDIEARKDKPYKLADERGLYLLVNPNGGKLWRMNYRHEGKQNTLSFGTHPGARKKATQAAQPPFEPGHQAAMALFETFMLRIGLCLDFFVGNEWNDKKSVTPLKTMAFVANGVDGWGVTEIEQAAYRTGG
jgi:hypothetical protein